MSSVSSSTYSLNISTLANYFDQAVQAGAEKLAIAAFGSQGKYIQEQVALLPANVDAGNVVAVRAQLETIITALRATHLLAETPALKTELDTIQNILDTGVAAPTDVQQAKTGLMKLLSWCCSFVRTPPAPTHQQNANQTPNVTTAFNRLKATLTGFNPTQAQTLLSQARAVPAASSFMSKVSYDIKALTFNAATLLAIKTVVYGILGVVGFKTAVIYTVAYYVLREMADKSMSLTNYESWANMPVIAPIFVPYVPVIDPYLFPGFKLPIPTWKGVKQIAGNALNYLSFWSLNRNSTWKPNFLEFNNVVILKNGVIPLHRWPAILRGQPA